MEENEEQWREIENNNSVCDIIMQDGPVGPEGQVMEVVEHILHYVSDIGLHYAFPEVWGISEDSDLARAMVAPTMQTLAEIGPTRAEEGAN